MAQEPEELKEYEYEYAGGVYTAQMTAKHAAAAGATLAGSGEAKPKAAGGEPTLAKKQATVKNKAAESKNAQ